MRKKKKSNKTLKLRNSKIISIGVLITGVFFILFIRIVKINSVYAEQAEKGIIQLQLNRKTNQSMLEPSRGTIYDRNMKSLANSYSVYNVILDVRRMITTDKKNDEYVLKTITTLGEHLNIPLEVMQTYVGKDENGVLINDTNYFIIAREVPSNVIAELKETKTGYYHTEEIQKRTYPHNNLASQILGFIRVNDSYGLEYSYNKDMTGIPGRIFNVLENKNDIVENRVDAKHGNSIVTNIDLNIQQYAEEVIDSAVIEYEPQKASVIVMNPKTGEVLAMAQYPSFNSNYPSNFDYIKYKELEEIVKEEVELLEDIEEIEEIDKELIGEEIEGYLEEPIKIETKTVEQLLEEQRLTKELNVLYDAWTNFNIGSTFEPGSIFKPMVVAGALDEGIITKDDVFFCPGGIKVGDSWIPCWDTNGHGLLTVTDILAKSCNVGMIEISALMGRETFYKYMKEFGMGEKTGIDLPNEASASTLVYSERQLNPVELATSSMGQGFNSTAIQQLVAFSAVINGGDIVSPYVVSQVIDKNGNIVRENKPKIVRKIISNETSNFMKIALQETVSTGGTGSKAEIKGYSIGGKTGTAQQGRVVDPKDQQYTISFVGYMQSENPDIIAIVVIDKPKEYITGVTTASPMMRELLLNIINYKNITPSRPDEEGITTNIKEVDIVVMDDFVGMEVSYAISMLNRKGMDFDIIDTGGDYISSHIPSAGITTPKTTRVYLKTETSENAGKLVFIPDFVGANVEQASQIITDLGLIPIIDDSYDLDSDKVTEIDELQKIVFEQLPKGERSVTEGTEIKLKVKTKF
jgi:stage V sporulation protein D (sporulation-specific penicillin-binding protein)